MQPKYYEIQARSGKGGVEYALTQLLIAIALLITGAGTHSLAPRLPKPLRKL